MAEPLKYATVIERVGDDYNAYVPDLPGCGAVGGTPDEVIANVRTAIELHIRSMREDGDPIPEPTATAVTIEVAA